MDLSFANPAGFWALLGIPAIIAIHFLQRQSKVLTISTLFLIEQLQRESVRGRKLERIRHSVPLWMQLLAVLLVTWILIQPRWIRPESVQRIALVLDSTASMAVYKQELAEALRKELSLLEETVSRTEYVAIDSAVTDIAIYNGSDLEELLAALDAWTPYSGAVDFAASLRIARSLVGGDGLVVLASDHIVEPLPFDSRLLAIGSPKPNVGFAGFSVTELDDGQPAWRCVVRNYSDEQQSRTWYLSTGTQRSPERTLDLGPGESRTLEGAFPETVERITLSLTADDFPFDDRLPLVLPQPKVLTVAPDLPVDLQEAVAPVIDSLDDLERFEPPVTPPAEGAGVDAASMPDMLVRAYEPISPTRFAGDALVFVDPPFVQPNFIDGPIAADNHPLIDGLNWQSLIARKSSRAAVSDSDTALVWQGDWPLIFLRNEAGARQLFINFDVRSSNADRLPAFIVLIHRFIETLRERKVAPMRANYETGQPVDLAYATAADSGEGGSGDATAVTYRFSPLPGAAASEVEEVLPLAQASLIRAPRVPGFFTVEQNGEMLLTAAAAFADTREADLREAASRNELSLAEAAIIEKHAESDSLWQVWLILILLALLLSWYFVERKRPADDPDPASLAGSSGAPS